MPIRRHIEALHTDNFNPQDIQNPFVFLQLHKGLTLVEHIAQRPNSISVLAATLRRYNELARAVPKSTGISHRVILNHYFYFFCERIAADNPPDIAQWVNETLPEMYKTLVASLPGNDQGDINIEPPQYFNFLSQLKPNLPFEAEPPLLHALRLICLRTHIGTIIRSSDETLPMDALSKALKDMANNPLYAKTSNTGLISHTSFQLKQYATILPFCMTHDLQTFTHEQKQMCLELLLILYLEGTPKHQATIIDRIDKLIAKNATDSLFIQTFLVSVMPYPLGRMQPRFRANAPDILGQLSFSSKMRLNESAKYVFEKNDSLRVYMEVTHIKPDPSLHSIWEARVNAKNCDKRIVNYLMRHGAPFYYYEFEKDFKGMIQDLHYYQIFSPLPGSCPIFCWGHSYLNDPARLKEALALGIREFRLHDYSPRVWNAANQLDQWTSVLDVTDDSVHFIFTMVGLLTYDAYISRHDIQPGPMNTRSWMCDLNYEYFLVLNHALQEPKQGSNFPIIRFRDSIKQEVTSLQSKMLDDDNPIWVVVSHTPNSLSEDTHLVYDLRVFKSRIEYGEFTRDKQDYKEKAQWDFPQKITFTPKSLYLISAKQAATLPALPEAVPDQFKKDINKMKLQ